MPTRHLAAVTGVLLSCLATGAAAQQVPASGVCPDLAATTLASLAEEDPWATLMALDDIKGVLDAYFEAPDGTKLDAAGKALAEIGVTLALGDGAGYLVQAGKFYYQGAVWTVEEAARLQFDAFFCGGVSGGERLPVPGFFSTGGAQAVVPGLTCENFGDRVTSFEQFYRLRDLFKGAYTSSLMQFARGAPQNAAEYQKILDAQWTVIERTWYAREGARRLKELQDDLKRIAQQNAAKRCAAPAGGELGADVSDPALDPEPPTPPGGAWVLVKTDVVTMPLAPDNQISAGPQKITFSAPYGTLVCTWTRPPKSVNGEFDVSIHVTSTPAAGQDLQGYITARSGFSFISGTVNEISGTANEAYANGTDGVAASGGASMRLGPGDLLSAVPGSLLYFAVGGCGGNVTYTYRFIG